MTDNKITREKTFSEELPYFKERIKEIFDNYDNPDGYADVLYLSALSDSNRIVRKAEEEIKHQQMENKRLEKEVNLVSIQFQDLQERYEEKQAEIERLENEVKLLTQNSITEKFPHCVLCGNGAIITKSLEDYDKIITDISSEAVKEFANMLKNKIKTECNPYGKPIFDYDTSIAIMHYIDKLISDEVWRNW